PDPSSAPLPLASPSAVCTMIPPLSEKERASLLCMKALVSRGRLDTVSQQMAVHPQYLESFLHSQHYILHMDGPLPLPYRHYIAIMAAARHRCSYLVSLHSAQFLRVGGDPVWLQGLEAAPPRLRHLDHINKVLAHRPWLSGRAHIQALLKPGEQCWSLAELVQAVVLLAHCHALCSFVFGSGTDPDPSPACGSNGLVSVGWLPLCSPWTPAARWLVSGKRSSERRRRRTGRAPKHSRMRVRAPPCSPHVWPSGACTSWCLYASDAEEEEEVTCTEPSLFVTDPEFGYQEFARRDEDHFQVFRVQDYSWEDHGFSLVNRLYSDIGHLLDERFRCVAALPFPRGPDLRRAVWNYIHCMFGIRYDDYDYGEVNQLLERELKLYIKAVACFPDITRSPLPSIHINLLIMEARLQAELLYALRAITQHMIG
uniref:Sestrin 4 n=1 Tax=Paramormyrops kingsleyae TaxID=1676925 RepID=A0A3B3Q9W2_9TELE